MAAERKNAYTRIYVTELKLQVRFIMQSLHKSNTSNDIKISTFLGKKLKLSSAPFIYNTGMVSDFRCTATQVFFFLLLLLLRKMAQWNSVGLCINCILIPAFKALNTTSERMHKKPTNNNALDFFSNGQPTNTLLVNQIF